MSEVKTKKKPHWARRILIGFALLLIALILLLIGLRWWITTDSGSNFIEAQIENRQLGPIKHVEIDGLSGDPFDALSLKGLRVYDRDGLWLTASDIEFDWSPWPLRKRHLVVEDLDIAQMEVLRKPVLEETEPGAPFTARIDDSDIAALILDEAIIGQAATLRVDAQGGVLEGGALAAVLNVIRTDTAGDEIDLNFERAANGNMSGTFEIEGQSGGTLATLLRAPEDKMISGQGDINGTLEVGSGTAVIAFGETRAIDARVEWSLESANIEAQLNTADWSVFELSRQAIGETVSVTAALDRLVTPQAFTGSATSVNLDAEVSGVLPYEGELPDALNFNVKSDRLGAILPLPEGYSLGTGSAKGRVQIGDIISGQAEVNVANVVSPYGRADRLSGPIALSANGKAYRLETTLRAVKPVTTAELPFTLGEEAVLKTKALLNLETRQVTELDATLTSGGNTTTAKGQLVFDASQLNLTGQVQANLKPIGSVPAGVVATRYTVAKSATSDLALTAAGTFRPQGNFAPPLEGLVGEVIEFDVDMTPIEGGVRLRDSLISTDGLRVAAMGRVTDTLDVSAEVAISKPVAIAALDITAPSQFSATVTGPRADPALRLDGTLEAATLTGQSFENIRLRTELTELLSAPKGPVRLTADTTYGPLDVEARLASTQAGYAVSDLDLTLAGLAIGGEFALDANSIASGQLALNLPQDGDRYARAILDLENVGGEQGVTLKADAKNVRYEKYAVETLTLNAAGTLTSLTGDLSLEGREVDTLLTREFGLDTALTLSRTSENAYRLELQPEADYGRYQLGHSEAVAIEYQAGKIGLDAPLTLNGKPFALNYTREDGAETLRVRARDLPMDLVPLPGNLGETKGRISVNLNARHGGVDQLSGQGVIKVTDWRGFDFGQGEGFTPVLTLDLQSQSVGWRLGTEDTKNLKIEGQGNLPLSSGESLAAIRPNMTASMTGQLNIQGAAKPLLTLITAEEAEPEGQLDARLDIGGTLSSPRIEGQATGKAIRLELPQLGTRLRDGRFTAKFTNDTIDVSDVYFRDNKDGTLEGGGMFKLGEYARPLGRLDVKANSFRALDRKDYEGRVSGGLFFESDEETATLGGDVTVNRAEVKQFVQGRVTVVEIDVEEINGSMDQIVATDRPEATPIKLDLRVRAPRRIFVRTNGLDVELGLDVTIKGTAAQPQLFGEANVRRGGYRIAGKELQFTEGGIDFNGSLSDAKVNLLAETDTQNISATVKITGTVEKPEIELSSTPERPQDEILSALLFGRSVTELSTIEAAQLAGALAQFSGAGGGFDLMGGLRDALGVGQLSIGVGEDGQASVSGGRYLAKDVYLQLFTGAGPDSTGAIIDWEIRRNLFLRSKVQSDNEQSLTLKYKKDF